MSAVAQPRPSSAAQALSITGLRKSYGDLAVVHGISIDVAAGTILSLIGPSGCGKTTTLRMIAGLETPDAGRIVAGGQVLTDGRDVVAPEARNLGMVFQTYALWPHMTVADNVAFGLRRRKWPSHAVGPKVADVLGVVGMGQLAERYPSQLSGGQQQRVALARAIACEPRILLFDEPLSNLDAVLREQMRFEIRALQQRLGITSVYVTHSQDEALAISDQIAVMRDGAIVQAGAPLEIYDAPRTEFVASFIGLANILELQHLAWDGGVLVGQVSGTVLRTVDQDRGRTAGRERAKLCIRPVDLRLVPAREGPNVLLGTVTAVSFSGGLLDVFVRLPDGTALRLQVPPPATVQPGMEVGIACPADRIVVLED